MLPSKLMNGGMNWGQHASINLAIWPLRCILKADLSKFKSAFSNSLYGGTSYGNGNGNDKGNGQDAGDDE
jgi:hypothetical protein